jgi:hypothetical protein
VIPKTPSKLVTTASSIAECRRDSQSCKTSIDPTNSVRPRAIPAGDAFDRNPSAKAKAVEYYAKKCAAIPGRAV